MPLKLSAGISKKMGLPDYGSLGATCHVEVELPAGLLEHDLEGLHRQVRNAYIACSQAVNDELARHRAAMMSASAGGAALEPSPGEEELAAGADGYQAHHDRDGDGDGRSRHNGDDPQPATRRQIDFLHALAKQIRGLGLRRLESVSQTLCEKPLADLSSAEASALIDILKNVRSGKLDLQNAFPGAAT